VAAADHGCSSESPSSSLEWGEKYEAMKLAIEPKRPTSSSPFSWLKMWTSAPSPRPVVSVLTKQLSPDGSDPNSSSPVSAVIQKSPVLIRLSSLNDFSSPSAYEIGSRSIQTSEISSKLLA